MHHDEYVHFVPRFLKSDGNAQLDRSTRRGHIETDVESELAAAR